MTADDQTVERAGRALADAASSPAQVFLFGSRARGDHGVDSDFDFLVVQSEVEDRFAEAVSLSKVLGRLRVPGDVVVVDQAHFDAWSTVSGTAIYDAAHDGRLVAESRAA
ncbi:MAG: nucleotidyltransferase domain-containing protein [Patulibacter sp.]|nr:nucleotidyltransferase domain-containing protein [Patulibacter sp.]